MHFAVYTKITCANPKRLPNVETRSHCPKAFFKGLRLLCMLDTSVRSQAFWDWKKLHAVQGGKPSIQLLGLRFVGVQGAKISTHLLGLGPIRVQRARVSGHLLGLMLVGVQGPKVERSVVPKPGAYGP